MEIAREKLVAMWGLIDRLAMEKTSVKFHYLLVKNKRLIEPEVMSLQEAQQPPEGYEGYEKKRIGLCELMCEKGENGKPKEVNKNFIIPEDTQEEFDKKLEEIKEEHKEVIKKMDSAREQFTELIKEDVEIEFAPIPLSVMPESILGSDVDLLFDLIDEEH